MQYFCQPLELNLKVRTLTSLDCLKSIYYNLLVYNGKATMKYTGLWSKNLLDQTVVTQDLVAGKTVTSKET